MIDFLFHYYSNNAFKKTVFSCYFLGARTLHSNEAYAFTVRYPSVARHNYVPKSMKNSPEKIFKKKFFKSQRISSSLQPYLNTA